MKRKILSALLALALCFGLAGTAMATEQQVVNVSNTEELLAAWRVTMPSERSNKKFVLAEGEYKLNEPLAMWMAENVTIQGTGNTRITVSSGSETVISLSGDCKNITLSGLTLGHDVAPAEGCSSGVIDILGPSDVSIIDCDIFGCGLYGISASGSTVAVERTTIRDCSRNAIDQIHNTTISFSDCIFSGNGYRTSTDPLFFVPKGSSATFSDCIIMNNNNPKLADTSKFYDDTCTFENCTYYGNGWGGDNVSTPPEIPTHSVATEAPATPNGKNPVAAPTAATVLVNGLNVPFEAYNIGGNNFFKLRDLAYVLNGSNKQFEISWDASARAVSLISGETYTPVGGEMSVTEGQAQQSAVLATSKILLDGKEVSLTAYNIGGNHYFKLRDMGAAFDFGVDWDDASRTIAIDTSKGYTA